MKLQYDLSVTGVSNVERALGTLERRYNESNRRMARKAGIPPGGGGASSARAKEMQLARLEQGVQRFQHKMALRNIAEEKKAKIAAERAAAKEAATAQRERIRTERASEREKVRQTRVASRHAQMAAQTRERFTRGAIGHVSGSVGGTTRALAGGATMALGLGGGMLMAESVRKAGALEREAAQLANMAVGVDGETRSRGEIAKTLTSQVRSEAVRTGLGSEGVLQAIREYHGKSGLMKNAQAILPFMTDISQAYNADITDVGRTGGAISQSLMVNHGINGAENVQKTKDIIAAMAGQAKIGSIEFADLATVMTSLMASTTRFKGDIVDLATTMGAVGQMAAAGGADSPEEAMTAIKRFSDDMIKYGNTSFKDNDIDVYNRDEKGNRVSLKDPAAVLFEVMKKTGGDIVKGQKMFKLRSDKAFAPFQSMFNKAGGGEAGYQAMMESLMRFKNARVSEEEVTTAASAVRGTAAGQYDIAMAKLQDSIGSKLLPALVKIIPEFERLIPNLSKAAVYFARFVAELASNPVGTIFKVIAAKLAMDIAAAGIGKVINAAAVAAVNRITGSRPVTATREYVTSGRAADAAKRAAGGGGVKGAVKGFVGMPSGGAMVGTAGASLGAGLSIASLIVTASVANIQAGEANMEHQGGLLKQAREAAARGDVGALKGLYEQSNAQLTKVNTPGFLESNFGTDVAKWTDPNLEVERKTAEKFNSEILALFKVAEENNAKIQMEAATAQKEAAAAQTEAANATKAAFESYLGPNRGNSPSKT